MTAQPQLQISQFASPRHCIRKAICDCLGQLANVSVCCEKFGAWKIPEELNEERFGINVTTARQVRNPAAEVLNNGCLGKDELDLLVDIEIVVLVCDEAKRVAEAISAAVSYMLCQHQNMPFHKIEYVGSDEDRERDTVCDYFQQIDTYQVRYTYEHCSNKIIIPRC